MPLLKAKKITTTPSFSPFNIATAFSDYNQQKGRILPLEIIYFARDYFFPFAHIKQRRLALLLYEFLLFSPCTRLSTIFMRALHLHTAIIIQRQPTKCTPLSPALRASGGTNCAPWRPFTKCIHKSERESLYICVHGGAILNSAQCEREWIIPHCEKGT